MVVCVNPEAIKDNKFHSEVSLSAGGRTAKLYTELKGVCPGPSWKWKETL